jgi:hypothetical protein
MSDLDGRITRAEAARDAARVSVEKAEVERADAVAGRKEAMATGDPIAIENAKELFASADANLRAKERLLEQAQASLDTILRILEGKTAGNELNENIKALTVALSSTHIGKSETICS